MRPVSDIGRKLLCALAGGGASIVSLAHAGEPAGSFDAAIEIVRVDLGPARHRDDSNVRNMLTCYYYPRLLIKEYSEGGSGADRLSMLRRRGKRPECELAYRRGERVIDPSQWHGYFKGVKDALVFFDPDDDFNGDAPFAVFDSVSGRKIFEDSAYGENVSSPDYRTARVQVVATDDGYSLNYRRVAYAD